MRQAVVVDCVRTPVGRAHKNLGIYRESRGDDLAATAIRALIERTRIDTSLIEDCVLGVSAQQRQQAFNVARMVSLMSGLPVGVAATSVNRLCGSSLQALNQAAQSIRSGCEDVQVVGGLEHMVHCPIETPEFVNPRLYQFIRPEALNMIHAGECVARSRGITREEQDAWALRSHRRALAATQAGEFQREIVPTPALDRRNKPILATEDQTIRPDTDMYQLSQLQTAYAPPPEGTVTAGNASPLSDGAAAMLVMAEETARSLGQKPLVRVAGMAVAGVEPELMGLGPIAAARKAVARAGLKMSDLDLIEINEAFACQVVVCIRELDLDEEKVNVRGGAIALGHPLGASGARICATLINLMRDRRARYGLVAMCIGVGQGIATVFERVDGV